jgi:DNA-binding phage protein
MRNRNSQFDEIALLGTENAIISTDRRRKTMALVNVSTALKRDEIKKILESQESPKYTYVKMKTAIEMQFDVQDDAQGSHGDLANYTKKIIKEQPWGAALMLRVLNEGQAFTGQK